MRSSSLAIAALSLATTLFAGSARAVPFQPVLDEFWILKNGAENFRDSFTDGVLPPSGPDGLTTYSSGPGFTDESGGRLTMTPSLGSTTIITSGFANRFTGALRTRSTDPASPNFLGFDSSFSIHGLFDMSSLPDHVGTGFGIRATDSNGPSNPGNDVVAVGIQRGGTPSGAPGGIEVFLDVADFVSHTVDSVSLIPIGGWLGLASQIEFVISKDAGSDAIGASFILYDGLHSILDQESLSTFSVARDDVVRIYRGENYTRAQFWALDTVPVSAPASSVLLALGLGALLLTQTRRGSTRFATPTYLSGAPPTTSPSPRS